MDACAVAPLVWREGRQQRWRIDVGCGCQCGLSRYARRCNHRFLSRVPGRLGRQADETQSRLELPFVPLKALKFKAQRSRRPPLGEALARNALEQAAERASQHSRKRAAGAPRSMRQDCSEYVIELRFAPYVDQTNGEFACLGLAERGADVVKGGASARRILQWTRHGVKRG